MRLTRTAALTEEALVAMSTRLITVAALIAAASVCHAQPSATLLWETEPQLKGPQSVAFDSVRSAIYVSNANVSPDGKGGAGFVSVLDTAGAIMTLEWVKGLRAPRGLALCLGRLYAADVTDLVEIETANPKAVKRYPGPDAQALTDVAVDRNGMVYVTDRGPKNSGVYRLAAGRFMVWVRQAEIVRPGGICASSGRIIVGLPESGDIYGIAPTRDLKQIGQVSPGITGMAGDGGSGFFVSGSAGLVSHVSHERGEQPFLELTDKGRTPADIEYVASRRMLLVATGAGNTVAAYTLVF